METISRVMSPAISIVTKSIEAQLGALMALYELQSILWIVRPYSVLT